MVKKILSLFLVFAIAFSMSTPAAAADVGFSDFVSGMCTFGEWATQQSFLAIQLVAGVFDDDICPTGSLDDTHTLVVKRTTLDGVVGNYYVCSTCGKNMGLTFEEAYSTYLSTLDSTTAGSGIAVSGYSASSVMAAYDYYPAYSLNRGIYSDNADNTLALIKQTLSSGNILVVGTRADTLLGYTVIDGRPARVHYTNPLGMQHASTLGVYSLGSLEIYAGNFGWCGSSSVPVFFSSSAARAYFGDSWLTSEYFVVNINDLTSLSISSVSEVWWFTGYWKKAASSSVEIYSSGECDMTFSTIDYQYDETSFSGGSYWPQYYHAKPGYVLWDISHIVVAPSGTDAITRTASLMQTINNYNIDNSYTDNSTTVNYFIGSLGDDGSVTDVYSPALYDEETLIFTEPISGTQYQTTGWTYDYTTRSYDLTLAPGTMTVADTDITQVICTYGDDAVTISYCDSSGTAVQTDEFAYVMASQSECNINGHTYNVETTKEPTCTAAGERTYTCSICGNQYVEEISKTDHTYADYTITQEPTCTAGGIASYTCSTCGAQITEKLDALGHDWLASEVTETTYEVPEGTSCPDCSGTTFTHTRSDTTFTCTCSDCGAEWTVEADVTYGSTTYTCSRCGESYVEQDGKGLSEGLGDAIKSFAKKAWSAIASGIGKLFSGFADLLGGIFGFFTETVAGGIKNFFSTLSDDSILGYYQDDTGTATLPEGLTSAMSMIPAFFGGLPAELQAPVIFGIAALFLIAALKLFL